jgi:hypothetical protein
LTSSLTWNSREGSAEDAAIPASEWYWGRDLAPELKPEIMLCVSGRVKRVIPIGRRRAP